MAETAHEAIKEHAVAVATAMRETGQSENDLISRLAADDRLGLSEAEITELVHADPLSFAGLAQSQVDAFRERAAKILTAHTSAAAYAPEAVL